MTSAAKVQAHHVLKGEKGGRPALQCPVLYNRLSITQELGIVLATPKYHSVIIDTYTKRIGVVCKIGFKNQLTITNGVSAGIDLIDVVTIYILIYITVCPSAGRVKIIHLFLENRGIFIYTTP